jgi:hypothetical protein
MVVVALCAVGARANADTVDPRAGGPAVDAVVQPAGQADTAANADAADPSVDGPAADAAVPSDGQAGATESGHREKKKTHVAAAYSAFLPTDGETRSNFGNVWHSFGFGFFRPEQPKKPVFSWGFTVLSKDGASDALLIPVTVGVQHGLSQDPDRQAYVAVRVGPYYGKVDDNLEGPDESKIGGCAHIALGLVIDRKYLLEARYSWFTKLAGNNFNGLTLTAGVKIAQFSL